MLKIYKHALLITFSLLLCTPSLKALPNKEEVKSFLKGFLLPTLGAGFAGVIVGEMVINRFFKTKPEIMLCMGHIAGIATDYYWWGKDDKHPRARKFGNAVSCCYFLYRAIGVAFPKSPTQKIL